MMQDKISAQLKNGKSVFITFLMVFFLVLLPDLNIQKGRAVYYTIDMMTEIYEYRPINIYRPSKNMTSRDQMIPLTDITLEEVSRYATIVMHYVNIEKGWNPGEYRIFFAAALANAPLAAFSIIHNDDKKKKKLTHKYLTIVFHLKYI